MKTYSEDSADSALRASGDAVTAGRPDVPAGGPAPKAAGRGRRPLWMLVPCGAALLAVVLVPVALTVDMSLHDVNVSTLRDWVHAPWSGLRNFKEAFTGPSVQGVGAARSLGISVAFSLLTTLVVVPVGFLAALSVHRPFRGHGVVRALYLIPHIIPMFVTALLARIMFLNHYGLVDRVLGHVGLASQDTYWLIGPNAFWAMTFTNMWAQWPFIYLLVLAGLQTIPREQLEAAEMDGASPLTKLRRIVLPQMSGLLKLGVLLSTLYHFGNFTLAYVMFSSPPPASVNVLPINAYFRAFSTFDYGVASAMAVLMMIILIVPGYIYLRATRMTDEPE